MYFKKVFEHAGRDEGFPNVSPSCFALWGSLGCPPATANTMVYGLNMAVTLGCFWGPRVDLQTGTQAHSGNSVRDERVAQSRGETPFLADNMRSLFYGLSRSNHIEHHNACCSVRLEKLATLTRSSKEQGLKTRRTLS